MGESPDIEYGVPRKRGARWWDRNRNEPRPDRKLPAKLLEVDRTLLDERVPALHRLLGLVIEEAMEGRNAFVEKRPVNFKKFTGRFSTNAFRPSIASSVW